MGVLLNQLDTLRSLCTIDEAEKIDAVLGFAKEYRQMLMRPTSIPPFPTWTIITSLGFIPKANAVNELCIKYNVSPFYAEEIPLQGQKTLAALVKELKEVEYKL